MKYTVVWKPAAERTLTAIWLAGSDRAAIARAAREIDRLLQTSPNEIGESRDANRRIAFELPLGVTYSVNSQDRLVKVLEVWRIGPANK